MTVKTVLLKYKIQGGNYISRFPQRILSTQQFSVLIIVSWASLSSVELIGSLEKFMFHTWVNPECILAITVSLCLHGSRYTLLFVLVCAQVIKLSLSGSQSDTYWIVTIKHSGEPELSALWAFCQCFALSQNQWGLIHHALSRAQTAGIPWVHITTWVSLLSFLTMLWEWPYCYLGLYYYYLVHLDGVQWFTSSTSVATPTL